jgi:hypothetical protein
MPLAYETREPLTIPGSAFNADDVATILVQGARYGGQWMLGAQVVRNGKPEDAIIGSIFTEADDRPSMAVDTAWIWVNDACMKDGVKLAAWNDLNGSYDAGSAPFFAAATFIIDRRK